MSGGKHTSQTTEQAKPVVPVGDLVVGSVIPYAGPSDVPGFDPQSWIPCDGRAISRATYVALFEVIGTLHGAGNGVSTFRLPDYRGWFLRGVDDGAKRDPDAEHRAPAAPGGHSGDACGSQQGYATALPHEAFELSEDGAHAHEAPNVPTGYSSYHMAGQHQAEWNSDPADTSEAGEHQHDLLGGDPESRPLNAYVTYLIRYRA